ncbi:protein of unknown function [Burkholderia sp. D7]|nr:protein of unknown function [Burkholderia sp. D7]
MPTHPSAADSQAIEPRKTLNVVFSHIAYDMISQLLSKDSRDEDIVIVSGGFHLGPIGNDDYDVREKWLRDNIDCDFSENSVPIMGESYAALTRSLRDSRRVFVWVDLMSSGEYAGFLYWIDRFKPSNLFIVQPKPRSDNVMENDGVPSLDSARGAARLTSSDELNEYSMLWNRLKLENAAFRLFAQTGEFRSFTIDSFDDVLVDSVAEDWKSMPKIVLKAMNTCWASGRSIPGDLFFYRRLIWLSENSKIELRGDSNEFSKLDLRTRR